MVTPWQIPPPVAIPAALLDWLGDPLLAELLARRGLTTVDEARAFLDPDHYEPAPAEALPGLAVAVERLGQALDRGQQICVWGDFDVDGQTATTLLVSTLQDLGGANVRYYIPDRLTESHGIKLPALQRQIERGLDLLLTCDTGITAVDAVEVARAAGVEVIITDHHDLGDTLPAAAAVINPKRLAAAHPLRELPGVGVAYKLSQALYAAQAIRPGGDEAEKHLDLVALGIVADVAVQTGDTRYLLQRGLQQLRRSRRAGLLALLAMSNLRQEALTEEHIGFWLGPRLNALGRLGDANQAVELLTTEDPARARILAAQLDALNERRKLLVDRVLAQALSQVEETPSLADYQALVLAGQTWHVGVIGLAAGRLAEHFNKPVVLIAAGPDGLGRGSARSVAGCDIHRALQTQAHLLRSFGGHPLAAGLSLPLEHLARFRQGLSAALAGCAPEAERTLSIDATVSLAEITPEFAARLSRLAPFGPGNPTVRLAATDLTLVGERLFGRGRNHRRLRLADPAGVETEVIWWGSAGQRLPSGPFDLAFTVRQAEPAGVQLEWLAARERQPVSVRPQIKVIDLRRAANPLPALEPILPQAQVWLEGETVPGLAGLTRSGLSSTASLVVWTAPPGADVLRQVLAVTQPAHLYLVARPSALDQPDPFLQRLLGLIKYSLAHHDGRLDLEGLAGAMAHRIPTVELALRWLVCRGSLRLLSNDETSWRVEAANSPAQDCAALEAALHSALAETAAYREFMQQAAPGVWRQPHHTKG